MVGLRAYRARYGATPRRFSRKWLAPERWLELEASRDLPSAVARSERAAADLPEKPELSGRLLDQALARARQNLGGLRLAEPAIPPPAALAEAHRFLRGNLTHALLEHLPLLSSQRWEAAAAAFVAARGAHLQESVRRDIVRETLAVLRDRALSALFGPDARAEVGIVAEFSRPGGRAPLRIAGRIDRLVQQGSVLLIVDYKTNRPPPSKPAAVADAYLLQLSAYRLAARQIFDALHVRAALLWTDGPRIMEIPGDLLDQQERRLWQLDSASLDA